MLTLKTEDGLVAIVTVVTGCIISIAVRASFRKATACSTME